MEYSKELNRVLRWSGIVISINTVAAIFPNTVMKTIVTLVTLYCCYKAVGIKHKF